MTTFYTNRTIGILHNGGGHSVFLISNYAQFHYVNLHIKGQVLPCPLDVLFYFFKEEFS